MVEGLLRLIQAFLLTYAAFSRSLPLDLPGRIPGYAGMYKNGHFKFTFNINQNYPHEPPKVKCTQKVRALCLALVPERAV